MWLILINSFLIAIVILLFSIKVPDTVMKSPDIDYKVYSDNVSNYSYIEENLTYLWIEAFEEIDDTLKINLTEIILDDRRVNEADGNYANGRIHVFIYTSIPMMEVAYHEVGHYVWYELLENETVRDFWFVDYWKRFVQCVKEYNVKKCLSEDYWKYSGEFYITDYAAKNKEEYFAEAFAHYFICKNATINMFSQEDIADEDNLNYEGSARYLIPCNKDYESCEYNDYTRECEFFEENPKVNQSIKEVLEEIK